MLEAKSNAVKSNIAQEPGMLGPGKLEVVKQEMARVNIDVIGIGKVKWIGMGEFNSDDHYIVGKNPLEEME